MSKFRKTALFLIAAFLIALLPVLPARAEGSSTSTIATAASSISLRDIKSPLSAESKTSFRVKLDGKNLSKDMEKAMEQLSPMLSNLVIDLDVKSISNVEKTKSSAYVKASTSIMGKAFNLEIWMHTDMTEKTPKFTLIIKLPKDFPLFATDKEYIVIDSKDLGMDKSGTAALDPAAMNDLTKKMTELVYTLCDELNTKFGLLADQGSTTVNTPVGDQPAHAYEIKLDDKTFKEALNYTVNTLLQKKDFLSLINELGKSMNLGGTAMPVISEKEIAELVKGFNEFYEKFKDVKIIGDKGLVFGFALSPDNYVVRENGLFDFVLDFQSLDKLFSNSATTSAANVPTGTLLLSVEFNSINYNINKDIAIDDPILTKANSTTLTELMAGLMKDLNSKNASSIKIPATTKPVVVKKPLPTPKPVVKKPVVKKTAVTTKKPIVKKPIVKKPVLKKPITKKP